jgi:hypothetical protein
MRATYRNLRERLITAEYEAKKQELKIQDLEDALTERKKHKEDAAAHNFSWTEESQHNIEEHELQVQLEKFILYKMIHHIAYLQKEVEKNK